MRCRRRSIFAAFVLSLPLMCALSLATSGQSGSVDALVADLPRGFVGEFQWDNDRTIQKIAFRFRTVRRIDAEHAEALGCGSYNTAGEVTSIDVRMQVTLPGLQVEIWESAPNTADFVTDGSHRGRLSRDFAAIDAEWTTLITGQRGRLRLRAARGAQCAASDST